MKLTCSLDTRCWLCDRSRLAVCNSPALRCWRTTDYIRCWRNRSAAAACCCCTRCAGIDQCTATSGLGIRRDCEQRNVKIIHKIHATKLTVERCCKNSDGAAAVASTRSGFVVACFGFQRIRPDLVRIFRV